MNCDVLAATFRHVDRLGPLYGQIGFTLRLSASDLVGHLNCRTLTALDQSVVDGSLSAPAHWNPLLETFWERGRRHEQAYIDHLRQQGHAITTIAGVGVAADAVDATLAAMRSGAAVIVQGAFQHGNRVGRADILLRVPQPSDLGAWSYEVTDTKLARETRGGTVLQLC